MNMMKKHSPLKNNPLRHPGQSLDEKVQSVLYDDVYPHIFVSFLFVIIAVVEWSEQLFGAPPNPLLWTFIALVAIGYSSVKISGAWKRIRNIRLGRDGERIVGQSLERMREMGYQVFHDVIDVERGFNIDHIIVGPGGVFTIETKTISKTSGAQKIFHNGDDIRYDGLVPDRNPIYQAKAQARWLREFIMETTGLETKVRPVVIFPGWFVESISGNSDVWVLNEKVFPSFLKNTEVVLDEEKVALISAQLAQCNRKVID